MELPGFELIEKLGEGGMATVWKARQLSLDRIVAIKILSARLARDEADAKRFQTEAQSTAKLRHPGIVHVYDANVHEGVYYFVMEYVAGYSVGDWIRRKGVISEADSLSIAEYVAEALNYAWEREGIIHCDIKPDNIMMDSDGTVKVADLGLARPIGTVGGETDEVMGTPNYMSPEQARCMSDLDCRTDIYSLGATLYHMVTGRMLFQDCGGEAAMKKQVLNFEEDPLDRNPELSMKVCWLIEKMLAKKRDDRYPDWKAVLADIRRVKKRGILLGAEPLEGASTIKRSPKRIRLHSHIHAMRVEEEERIPPVVWVAILVLAAAAAAFGLVRLARRDIVPPPKAGRITPGRDLVPAEEVIRRMYQSAEQWAADNPDGYEEAIERFRKVARHGTGTRYSPMAAAKIEEMEKARAEAIRGIMTALQAEADRLLAENRFEEAMAAYGGYAGKLSRETAAVRMQQENAIREKAGQFRVAQAETARRSEQKMVGLVDGIASRIVGGDAGSALTMVVEAMKDPDLDGRRNELEVIERLVRSAKGLDDTILQSFGAQVGQMVTVLLPSGSKTIKVSGVSNGGIQAEEKVMKDSYTFAKTIELKPSDLSLEETLRRLGESWSGEIALMKGILSVRAGAYDRAKKYFAETDAVLSGALVRKVGEMAEHQAGESAELAPARLPVSTAPTNIQRQTEAHAEESSTHSQRAGEAVAGDHAVAKMLLDRNPELVPKEITMLADREGKVCRIEIISPGIVDIGPVATLKDVAEFRCGAIPQENTWWDKPVSRLNDISALKGLPLEYVYLGLTSVSDLTPLKGMKMRELHIRNTPVTDLSPLKQIPLERLDIRNTRVSDLTPLSGDARRREVRQA